MIIKLSKLFCKRCGYEWVPKKEEVRVCPKCHSPYFDKERKVKKKPAEERNPGR